MDIQSRKDILKNRENPLIEGLWRNFFNEFSEADFDRLYADHMTMPNDWHEGDYKTSDGWRLRYTFSSCTNPKGLIVLLQGRAQSAHEYYEFINIAHEQGYAVFTFDRRSHGNSQGYFDDIDPSKTDHHIPDISLQIRDVAEIMNDVVKQSSYADLPRVMVGHSMGGAEGAMHLKSYQYDFNAVVYLAPMWAIHLDNNPIKKLFYKIFRGPILRNKENCGELENRAKNARPWDIDAEKEVFSDRKTDDSVGQVIQPLNTALGLARQVGVPTWGTAKEILDLTTTIQTPDFYDDIKIPSLNLLARVDEANDTPVIEKLSKQFGIETHVMSGRHQTLNELHAIKTKAYCFMFKFLNSYLPRP